MTPPPQRSQRPPRIDGLQAIRDDVATLRSDVQAHAKTITELVTDQRQTRDQVGDLHTAAEIRVVEDRHLDERLDRIEASIRGIYRLGWWILGAFGTSAVALIANFAFRGGFIVP